MKTLKSKRTKDKMLWRSEFLVRAGEVLKEKLKELDHTKVGFFKAVKKRMAEFHNLNFKPFKLDFTKFSVKSHCKHCYGTGKDGYINGTPNLCRCVHLTEEYKNSLREKVSESPKPVKETKKPVEKIAHEKAAAPKTVKGKKTIKKTIKKAI